MFKIKNPILGTTTEFKLRIMATTMLSCFMLACGGTGQDEGSAGDAPSKLSLSGIVIDGQLARATVFVDSNNNGTRDPWEAKAFTDNDGYYSYNPLTDTNYCEDTASEQEQEYCLETGTSYSNFVLRIDGGYDTTTNEPFSGQMSRRVNLSDDSDTSQTVISPLSSLFTDLDADESAEFLSILGLTESDLNLNYLDQNYEGSVNASLFSSALKIHKIVSVLADRLEDTYSDLGEEFGTPNDASAAVYPALADAILALGTDLDSALENSNVLINALDSAEEELRALYTLRELDLPGDLGTVEVPGGFERIVSVAIEIPEVIDVLIDQESTELLVDDILGDVRTLEVLVIKVLDEDGVNESVQNVIDFITDSENETLVESLSSALSEENADLDGISNNDFTGADFDSEEEIIEASTLPSDALPFSSLSDKRIKVSELDLGEAPNNLKDSEVEFYFNGDVSALEGSFAACIKYIDGASTDGSLGEANTRGELAEGYWSLLGATEAETTSYSLLLTVSFLGTTYQAIMKPIGSEYINDIEYEVLRFDNDGDIGEWHSENGIEDNDDTPTTNLECQERLPSRVGL